MWKRDPGPSARQVAERSAQEAPANVLVSFDRQVAAQCLWDYGEDQLAETALGLDDEAFEVVQRVATVFHDAAYPLPLAGQRITNGHVIAFAVVTLVEGLRPLARTRRRPSRDRPSFG